METSEAHAAIIEKMRADNAEALEIVQLGAAERLDAAEERTKVAEEKRDVAVGLLKSFMEEREEALEVINKHHARELHIHGKTIARMKGTIRGMNALIQGIDSPIEFDETDDITEDTPAVEQPAEPVPGENEETD